MFYKSTLGKKIEKCLYSLITHYFYKKSPETKKWTMYFKCISWKCSIYSQLEMSNNLFKRMHFCQNIFPDTIIAPFFCFTSITINLFHRYWIYWRIWIFGKEKWNQHFQMICKIKIISQNCQNIVYKLPRFCV